MEMLHFLEIQSLVPKGTVLIDSVLTSKTVKA